MVRHPSKKLEAKDLKKLLALGMLGLLVAFAMALGTSATFRDFEVSRSTHIEVVADDNELIDLRPGQPYAYINDEGKLVIEISKNNPNWPGNPDSPYYDENWTEDMGIGISVGSNYNFDHVFYVSNHLWENKNITVRIVSSSEGVAFFHPAGKVYGTYTGETPTESDEAITDICFVLEPGTELGISMEFAGGAKGSYASNITVYAWPEEDFKCPSLGGGG
ncbi:hypothetical protein DRN44_07240 [Thermococci archaeon]|nr:MAG: hypothetical protein DRN44_07240 [Thermococci archaeon]